MLGHQQTSIPASTEGWSVCTSDMRSGCLVYGFHEPKGIVPLPSGRSVKGEPHLEEQGPHPKLSPNSSVLATRSTSKRDHHSVTRYPDSSESDSRVIETETETREMVPGAKLPGSTTDSITTNIANTDNTNIASTDNTSTNSKNTNTDNSDSDNNKANNATDLIGSSTSEKSRGTSRLTAHRVTWASQFSSTERHHESLDRDHRAFNRH